MRLLTSEEREEALKNAKICVDKMTSLKLDNIVYSFGDYTQCIVFSKELDHAPAADCYSLFDIVREEVSDYLRRGYPHVEENESTRGHDSVMWRFGGGRSIRFEIRAVETPVHLHGRKYTAILTLIQDVAENRPTPEQTQQIVAEAHALARHEKQTGNIGEIRSFELTFTFRGFEIEVHKKKNGILEYLVDYCNNDGGVSFSEHSFLATFG